ncbi:MAG TPA: GxxExxY protein [Ignavibacteria bacterium]|nr:GxxExxY protein [Ignavibacteria bacterium]
MNNITQKLITEISYKIIGCAIEVHKELGPGLLEHIYEICLIEELKQNNLDVKSQITVPLSYKGKPLDTNLRIDLVVNDLVIVELKTVEKILPVHKAQLLTYLKLAEKPKGLLINFYTDVINNGIESLVTERFAILPKE